MADFEFYINGIKQTIDKDTITPETTLNEYLRKRLHLTGTKYMCNEGGCGACIVTVKIRNPRTGNKETFAVNSCLVSIFSCQNWEILTIEGLGNRRDGYTEAQHKIVEFNGTQCGFCTPGMLMNLKALQETGKMTMAEIENSFGGNICRCTGYRPILTAFKSMASDKHEDNLEIIRDIEDLGNGSCTAGICGTTVTNLQLFDDLGPVQEKIWYSVTSLKRVFEIIRFRRKSNFGLVAGNTSKGVYKDNAKIAYYIDVQNVLELRTYSHNTSKLILGANLTISETMDIFRDVAGRDDDFKYLNILVEHLDLVATVPVRNVGTLAGNLVIKRNHKEFPSDIFLLFEVIGAKLVIDNGRKLERVTLKDYLFMDMRCKLIRSIELPPLDESYKLGSYKIMTRAQNTHAMVNAGFLFQLAEEKIVKSATIVFGGINPQFVHATNAESFIVGKDLFNNANMQNLFAKLNQEVQPDEVLPEASPAYRKQLAIALTYKFILSIAPKDLLSDHCKSGAEKLKRAAVSHGTQEYHTNMSMYPVGQPVSKLEAADQASGEAKYVTDLPDLHNQAYSAFVLGEATPGSILKSIDPSGALAVPGVLGFFQATDIEELGGVNSFMAPNNPLLYREDEEIFLPVNQPIKFYYQPIGIVVATSSKLAEKAAELIKMEFEDSTLSPILSIRDALTHNQTQRIIHQQTLPAIHQDTNTPIKLNGHVDLGFQYHYHMELQVANVVPDDDGGFTLYPNSQWLDGVQFAVSRALNLPANTLNLSVKRIGGSFGAKINRNQWTCCAATLAALKLNQPVKFDIPLTTNMKVMGKRNAASCDYDVGVYKDGRIGYLDNEIYNNNGAYTNCELDYYILDLYLNTFVPDSFMTDTFLVRTDVPASTYMRAPGSVEGCAMIQSIIEHIAYKLDMDPIDVRLANLNTKKHPLLAKIVDDCLEWSNYRKRRAEIEGFNKVNRWRKRGISLVPMAYTLAFLSPHSVQVSIYYSDGTIAITHGGVDIGQGINTKVAQVAAYLLDVDIKTIKIKPTNNFVTPNNMTTGGSVTTEGVIIALKRACENLKKRINDAAVTAKLPKNATWLTMVRNAFANGVSLTENQMFHDDPNHSANYTLYAAAVCEVEVDVLTGNNIIQRVDIIEDVGDSLNPAIDIGQVEGAFVMGSGYWTTEQIVFDHDGALKTTNTWTYKPPGARDIPVDFRVKLPEGIPNPVSPFKNKSTTEPPICLAVSVPFAIRHAIKSARVQSDPNAEKWCPMNGPSSVEWTFLNCLNDYKQYKL